MKYDLLTQQPNGAFLICVVNVIGNHNVRRINAHTDPNKKKKLLDWEKY